MGKKQNIKSLRSKVMTIANALVKQGYNRSNAMSKAWILVKMPVINTKVAGVTFGKRQKAIEHLTHYAQDDITITLEREQENQFDSNAVAVNATVKGKGSYIMGYLPKALAQFIAPVMDKGHTINSKLKYITGSYAPYMNYGLDIDVKVV